MNEQICIYMPCIFWHDRKGILSIDVIQQSCGDVPIYKIATASVQKEIRVWNFRLDPFEASESNKKLQAAASVDVKHVEMIESKDQMDELNSVEDGDVEKVEAKEEDSIIFIEKESVENGAKNVDCEIKVDIRAAREELEEKKEVVQIVDVSCQLRKKGNRNTEKRVPQKSLSVEFLANLEGHRFTTNVVRFSPNGNFLASGDADGFVIIWALVQNQEQQENMEVEQKNTAGDEKSKEENSKRKGDPEIDIPPNKENWIRSRARISPHPGEVSALCFSPDSEFIAAVSMNNTISVNRVDNGKRLWDRSSYRHFANGIVWDPRGKYLITMSTDRRLDVVDARRGTLLRSCFQVDLPAIQLPQNGASVGQKSYKIFHDDQLHAFQRGVEFSPCGDVVLAPAAHLEVGTSNIYGTFAFLRPDLDFCRPTALFPTTKPTIQVRCSPVIYKLEKGANFLGLGHRLIFAVLCLDSVLLYNSQCDTPFAYLSNLHYDGLTSIAWTPDGRILVVSSLEGFNSFISVDEKKLGAPCALSEVSSVQSPVLIRKGQKGGRVKKC